MKEKMKHVNTNFGKHFAYKFFPSQFYLNFYIESHLMRDIFFHVMHIKKIFLKFELIY